jgi:hypothetical protein
MNKACVWPFTSARDELIQEDRVKIGTSMNESLGYLTCAALIHIFSSSIKTLKGYSFDIWSHVVAN